MTLLTPKSSPKPAASNSSSNPNNNPPPIQQPQHDVVDIADSPSSSSNSSSVDLTGPTTTTTTHQPPTNPWSSPPANDRESSSTVSSSLPSPFVGPPSAAAAAAATTVIDMTNGGTKGKSKGKRRRRSNSSTPPRGGGGEKGREAKRWRQSRSSDLSPSSIGSQETVMGVEEELVENGGDGGGVVVEGRNGVDEKDGIKPVISNSNNAPNSTSNNNTAKTTTLPTISNLGLPSTSNNSHLTEGRNPSFTSPTPLPVTMRMRDYATPGPPPPPPPAARISVEPVNGNRHSLGLAAAAAAAATAEVSTTTTTATTTTTTTSGANGNTISNVPVSLPGRLGPRTTPQPSSSSLFRTSRSTTTIPPPPPPPPNNNRHLPNRGDGLEDRRSSFERRAAQRNVMERFNNRRVPGGNGRVNVVVEEEMEGEERVGIGMAEAGVVVVGESDADVVTQEEEEEEVLRSKVHEEEEDDESILLDKEPTNTATTTHFFHRSIFWILFYLLHHTYRASLYTYQATTPRNTKAPSSSPPQTNANDPRKLCDFTSYTLTSLWIHPSRCQMRPYFWNEIPYKASVIYESYFPPLPPSSPEEEPALNSTPVVEIDLETEVLPPLEPEIIIQKPPPIINEIIVEEIIYTDNIELETRERELLRQRNMIQEYQLDRLAIDLEMETWNRLDENVWAQVEQRNPDDDDEEQDGHTTTTTLEGIASKLERTVNELRGEITTEKKRLDSWQYALLDARNALDAVVYDDGSDLVKSGRWRSRAEGRFGALMEIMDTFPGGGGEGGWSLTYDDFGLFMNDELLEMVDVAFEEIFRDDCRNPESLAILESMVKERRKEEEDDDEEEDWKMKEAMKKEEEEEPKEDSDSEIGLTLGDLVAAQERIESESRSIMMTLTNDTEVVERMDEWVSETLKKMKNRIIPYMPPDEDDYIVPDPTATLTATNDQSPPNRLLPSQILSLIDTQLETYHADLTDQIDYASVRTGAKILRSGPRGTSPSVSSSLPLINLILSKLNLRFYGHRAEAALNPTHPPHAVGQCWSVEPEGSRRNLWETVGLVTETVGSTKVDWSTLDVDFPWEDGRREISDRRNDSYRGAYATLAVRLAKPVRVREVVVEHPPREVMEERGSAVREFRVVGFEDGRAQGHSPWLLGSFVYDSGSNVSMQKFSVTTVDENGRTLPPLSSIVLAIDSNWGADFTCLYRFRVHGI